MAYPAGVTPPTFGNALGSAAAGAAPGIIASVTSGAAAGSVVPLWGTLVGAGVGLFSSLFGAHQENKANTQAAKIQADAQTRSAELQKQAADEALAYQRDESARSWASNEAARHGNYDISAARERRLGSLGELVGAGPREIPAYLPDPGASGGFQGAPMTRGTSSSPGSIASFLTGVYSNLGVKPTGRGTGPTDIAYFGDQMAATGGLTPGNQGYWADRIKQELAKSGGGVRPAPSSAAVRPGSVASYLQPPPPRRLLTPALSGRLSAYAMGDET